MSGMHWEWRNKLQRGHKGYPVKMRRLPGTQAAKQMPTLRKYFPGKPPVDAPAPAAQKVRKGRITLPKISLLEV